MKSSSIPTAVVIGAGYAGMSAAICLAEKGYKVTILEKNSQVGGRARMHRARGFKFDMGPSWYWMPEVMASFFERFGKSVDQYLDLVRLEPSYKVIFSESESWDIPASFDKLTLLFEQTENGAGAKLEQFMKEAGYKYKVAMENYVKKPGLSIAEYCNKEVLHSFYKMDMLHAFSKHARKYFTDKRLLQIIEFPVLFLGAPPSKIPAMYSLMNYADMKLGTWYPMGGMYQLSLAFARLAVEFGVQFVMDCEVKKMMVTDNKITSVITEKGTFNADIVVSGADYHHTDQQLLPGSQSNYSSKYWNRRQMAPSCLLYYIGVSKKLPKLQHHNLFFEHDFAEHAAAIYKTKTWPEKPLFYLCCPSKTDPSVAPEGMENLFLLIPVPPGLEDTEAIREHYCNMILKRVEQHCGEEFIADIVYKKSYAHNDFVRDYNAFKGNAYGLANTLNQTAMFKPAIRHKNIRNLFYTGQLTVPGPGVPPAIISGQVVADHILKYKHQQHEGAI